MSWILVKAFRSNDIYAFYGGSEILSFWHQSIHVSDGSEPATSLIHWLEDQSQIWSLRKSAGGVSWDTDEKSWIQGLTFGKVSILSMLKRSFQMEATHFCKARKRWSLPLPDTSCSCGSFLFSNGRSHVWTFHAAVFNQESWVYIGWSAMKWSGHGSVTFFELWLVISLQLRMTNCRYRDENDCNGILQMLWAKSNSNLHPSHSEDI